MANYTIIDSGPKTRHNATLGPTVQDWNYHKPQRAVFTPAIALDSLWNWSIFYKKSGKTIGR